MSNVVPFKRPVKKLSVEAGKGNILCKEGHHKWKIVQDKQFDSRAGKLVTLYECSRCQRQKTKLL